MRTGILNAETAEHAGCFFCGRSPPPSILCGLCDLCVQSFRLASLQRTRPAATKALPPHLTLQASARAVYAVFMPALRTYFRQHPWQRRLVTVLLALVLGALAAVLALPWYIDTTLIGKMDSPNADQRDFAVLQAVKRAKDHPAIIDRMAAALPGSSDRQFEALVRALETLDKFDVPGRSPEMHDRRAAMEVAGSASDTARRVFLIELMTGGRDNPYVRKALAAAAADANSDQRCAACALAGRLGDDGVEQGEVGSQVLEQLGDLDLADRAAVPEPGVRMQRAGAEELRESRLRPGVGLQSQGLGDHAVGGPAHRERAGPRGRTASRK